MAASVPSFQLSDGDPESSDDKSKKISFAPPVSPNNLLSVPAPIRSNVGVNNPLNKSQPGQFPLLGSQQVAGAGSATGNPRNKVGLAKGFSLMDWIRLTKSGKDLTGVGGPMVKGKIREVTKQELRKHKKRKDAWMALNGAVYNVTHYMDFHPGGWDELVKGAGRDATDMFNEIHKWVNYQGLLEACLVGKLVDGPPEILPPSPKTSSPSLLPPGDIITAQETNKLTIKEKVSNLVTGLCTVLPPIPSKPPTPTMDYFQTDTKVTVNIYTKRKGLKKHNVILDNDGEKMKITTILPQSEVFVVHIDLDNPVLEKWVIRVGESSGKIEVDLEKRDKLRWQSLGSPLEHHLWFGLRKDLVETYREWTVSDTCHVTHNTKHIVLSPPWTCHQVVGPGHHVQWRTSRENTEIVRSYTPVNILDGDGDGNLHFLIKIYPDGALTPYVGSLSVGDKVNISDTSGTFSMSQIPSSPDAEVYLLAAGTGITPMLSILHALKTFKQKPKLRLFTFDRTIKDIIWKDQIQKYQSANSSWMKVTHVVSSDEFGWEDEIGKISEALLRKYIEDKTEVKTRWAAVCGPPGFNREAVRLLKDCFSFVDKTVHVFEG